MSSKQSLAEQLETYMAGEDWAPGHCGERDGHLRQQRPGLFRMILAAITELRAPVSLDLLANALRGERDQARAEADELRNTINGQRTRIVELIQERNKANAELSTRRAANEVPA